MPLKIVMIGPYPPPLHGQSLAMRDMEAKLKDLGALIVSQNVAGGMAKKLSLHVSGLHKIIYNRCPCYISLNSNSGMWLSICLVFGARLLRRPLYIHHHSYSYITRPTVVARLMAICAGASTTHIVLSEQMADLLSKALSGVVKTFVLNNAGFVSGQPGQADGAKEQVTLGFFSNVTVEKGIDDAIDTVVAYRLRGRRARLIVAGPVMNEDARFQMERGASLLGDDFIALGAISADAKARFFADIDVLLFPSRYRHEASPLVLFEAMAAGVPSLTTPIGSIAEAIGVLGGVTIVGDYVTNATDALVPLVVDLKQASKNARDQYDAKLAEHQSQIAALFSEISALSRRGGG